MLKEELSTYIDLSNSSLVGYILGNFERFPLLTEEEEVATTVFAAT